MWRRKELKKDARQNLKNNYWRAVIVCLLMAFFVGAYSFSYTSAGNSGQALTAIRGGYNADTVYALATGVINDNISQDVITEFSSRAKATRGVVATIFNNTTREGSFIFGVLRSVNQVVFNDRIMAGIIIFIGAVLSFLYWMLIGNVLRVGERRFFLESRLYKETRVNRILYLYRVRRMWNVAKIQFLKIFFTILWGLTIVGGPYKGYAYRMIPHILAENPDIGRKEAFQLSCQMMRGHKWRAFLLDCSFIPWSILSILSVGVVGFLYLNPYRAATNAELYRTLRANAIAEKYLYWEQLNDRYLFEYEAGTAQEQYPRESFSIPEHPGRRWLFADYHRHYTVNTIILLFFTYCLIGWVWEISYYLFTEGGFKNPGTLYGPWLPIYGTGGVLVVLLLKKWRDHPIITFFLAVALFGVIEYFAGWCLETLKGVKWWDYSGYFLNLHGRICFEGLLVFGLAGCASIYFLAPILDDLYARIPLKVRHAIATILVAIFIMDFIYSFQHPNNPEGIIVPEESLQMPPPPE